MMIDSTGTWTTESLFDALQGATLFLERKASLELIDGVEPALHITMHEYGDLPVFITVAGDQIIAESVLWSAEEVRDQVGLNDAVLRTHKYFPLSTISLDTLAHGKDYYHMFGALSSTSDLANVVFEVEVLASNVIQATEAYADFLITPNEAQA
ncbi:MAG: YjfI family protein [Cellvibrionaceae bacterium]|nr:YjfI family protein [Cellvibrionaceae bacterium]